MPLYRCSLPSASPFDARTQHKARQLLIGTVLIPGQRTVRLSTGVRMALRT